MCIIYVLTFTIRVRYNSAIEWALLENKQKKSQTIRRRLKRNTRRQSVAYGRHGEEQRRKSNKQSRNSIHAAYSWLIVRRFNGTHMSS